MATSPETFVLGPCSGPQTKDNGEVLGEASPPSDLARDEAVSSMVGQLWNFLSGLLSLLLLLLLCLLFFFKLPLILPL